MNPDNENVRVARREALPHLRKEVRTLPTNGSAPWRAIPSHPEGQRDKGKTGLPGAPQIIRAMMLASAKLGWKLGCLKSESRSFAAGRNPDVCIALNQIAMLTRWTCQTREVAQWASQRQQHRSAGISPPRSQ